MLTGHAMKVWRQKDLKQKVYVGDVIRRQQELNELSRRNTQQAQARQRKNFDKKVAGAKAFTVGDYVLVFQNVIPPKGNKKIRKWMGSFNRLKECFNRLNNASAHPFRTSSPITPQDGCIPENDRACESNAKGTR